MLAETEQIDDWVVSYRKDSEDPGGYIQVAICQVGGGLLPTETLREFVDFLRRHERIIDAGMELDGLAVLMNEGEEAVLHYLMVGLIKTYEAHEAEVIDLAWYRRMRRQSSYKRSS